MQHSSFRILVMGVSGCGKSLIGQTLAAGLGATFIDGDRYHAPTSIAKMASGTPLTDDDRLSWLTTLAGMYRDYRLRDESVVIACSGLKKRYRDLLRQGDEELRVLFLEGDQALLKSRLNSRAGHFFKGDAMLADQLETLEVPSEEEATTVSIALTPEAIVARFIETLGLSNGVAAAE